jgi:general secretion pathway protein I
VKQERGFTLLEMIVATTIMGIAVVGLLAGISGATRNAARLREYDRAVQLARLRINELLVDQRLPRNTLLGGAFDRAETGGVEAGWQAKLSAFEMPPVAAPGQMALDRIQLEVWWTSGAQRRTFTLDAFRPRVLKAEDLVPLAPQ